MKITLLTTLCMATVCLYGLTFEEMLKRGQTGEMTLVEIDDLWSQEVERMKREMPEEEVAEIIKENMEKYLSRNTPQKVPIHEQTEAMRRAFIGRVSEQLQITMQEADGLWTQETERIQDDMTTKEVSEITQEIWEKYLPVETNNTPSTPQSSRLWLYLAIPLLAVITAVTVWKLKKT